MGIKYLRNFPWKFGEVSYDSSPIKHWSHLPIDYHSLRQCKITPYKMRLPESLEFSTWQMYSNIFECMWCLVMPCVCFWWPMHPFPPSSKSLPEGKEHKHPNTVLNTSVSHKTNQKLKHLAYRCTLRWNIHIHNRPKTGKFGKSSSKVPWLVGIC